MTRASAKRILLRGFIEQTEDGEWHGICLTLNLPVKGRSLEEVEHKLRELASAYLEDAYQKGDFHKMYPRRAPLSYYLRYSWLRLLSILNLPSGDWHLFSTSFSPFALNA